MFRYYRALAAFLIMLFSHTSFAVLNKSELDRAALGDGFGYKYANLQQLQKLSKKDYGAYKIAVPEFHGISYFALQKYLGKHLNLGQEWSAIVDKYFANPKEQDELFARGVYPEEFLKDCADLRERIHVAFAKNTAQADQGVSLDASFASHELDGFLEKMRKHGQRLMVRSTGKEDTKELANAGGNESESNVKPDSLDVLRGIEKVVVSYFGEKSLKQRLGAKDRSLFEKTAFTPVLLQHMIGERDPHALPKCGVMFSEEAEAGIARYEIPDGRQGIKTTGITLIQSAYGHNEGVVNSLIPVDSYYIDKSQNIYPIIRPKTYRMMPTDKSGELKLEKNELAIVREPALNREALKTLKNCADRLEKFYQGPMDVEFVVNEGEKTIYLVQARPLVHNKGLPNPSYLKDVPGLKSFEHMVGSAIGVAGGAIRLCNKDQSVLASDIGQALVKYQAHKNAKDVQCIMVGKTAPATSHEATSFRSEAKPVVYFEDWQHIERWLERSQARVLLSPQQNLAINWKGDVELFQSVSAPGWISYPAAPYLSLMSQFDSLEPLSDAAIKKIYAPLKSSQLWQSFESNALKLKSEVLFEQLLSADDAKVQLALASILYKIKNALQRASVGLRLSDDQKGRIEAIQSFALHLAQDIKAQLASKPGAIDFPKRLLPIHFLRALYFQRPSPAEIVQGESVLSLVAQELALEQSLTQALVAKGIALNDELSMHFLKLGTSALNEELENKWFNFVVALDAKKDVELNQNFAKILFYLGQMDLLPLWLHTSFDKNPETEGLLQEFAKEGSFLAVLTQKRAIIEALTIAGFANAKSFYTQWKSFDAELLQYFSSDGFLHNFSQAGSLGKFAAITLMGQLVDKFDLGIKELKANAQFEEAKQLQAFQLMLKGYFALLQKWLPLGPPHLQEQQYHLESLGKAINKKELTKADLNFSEYFDVAAFSMGSATSMGRVMHPKTLEDAFSATHQDLLVLLGALTLQAGAKDVPLPALLKKVSSSLSLGSLRGLELKGGEIRLVYNRSLREHGVQYSLSQRQGSNKVTLNTRFSASNENNRWDRVAHFVAALKLFGKFDVKNVKLASRGVGFDIILDDRDDLAVLNKILDKVESATTALASGYAGGEYLSFKSAEGIENAAKGLAPAKSLIEFVSAFEKEIGLASMSEAYDIQNFFPKAIEENPVFMEQMARRALELERNPTPESRWKSMPNLVKRLIGDLVDHGHGFGLASEWATQKAQSKYDDDKRQGIRMFEKLVSLGAQHYYDDAARGAVLVLLKPPKEQEITFFGSEKEEEYINLFEELFKRGAGFAIAFDGAKQALIAENKAVNEAALELLGLLKRYFSDETAREIALLLHVDTISEDHKLKLREMLSK